MIKIHLILQSYAVVCNSIVREGGRQAVTTLREFEKLPDDMRCAKCARTLSKMRAGLAREIARNIADRVGAQRREA